MRKVDTVETLEEAEEWAEDTKKSARSGFTAANGYISIITYTMATYFMREMTLNDHPDVDFITLLVQYTLIFGGIYVIKILVVKNALTVKQWLGGIIYDMVQDVFTFINVLFFITVLGLIQSYFEFGIDDLYAIIVLFLLFSFFTRLGLRVTTNARIY